MLLFKCCERLGRGTSINLFYWNFLQFRLRFKVNMEMLAKLMTSILIMALTHSWFRLA